MLRKALGASLLGLTVFGCFGDASFSRSTSNATSAACTEDADCAPALPCTIGTCFNGTCAEVLAPAGTPTDKQVAGDCLLTVCSGTGSTVEQPDAADLLDDGNACTLEGCSQDGPVMALLPAGSQCGDRACCDSRGACMPPSCVSDADCGAPAPSSCESIFCNDCGQCEGVVAPHGTFTDDAIGDCQVYACDGAGGMIPTVDPSDLPPDDGDPCTIEECAMGMPTYKTIECPFPQTCYMGLCQ